MRTVRFSGYKSRCQSTGLSCKNTERQAAVADLHWVYGDA